MGDFTLPGYRALLEAFLGRGYEVTDYHRADPGERHLILRHDLDVTIDAALPLAAIEQELGACATYFVLVRTEMYNPFSAQGLGGLKRLMDMGHEVGLHLDASLYGNKADSLDAAAEMECTALEALIGRPVGAISLHRPAPALQGFERSIAGRRHAYEPRFFREMGYCSDSRGSWHHGHPLDHAAVAEGRALQLLTHPVWWNDDAQEPHKRLAQLLEEKLRRLDLELAAHQSVHRPRHGGGDDTNTGGDGESE